VRRVELNVSERGVRLFSGVSPCPTDATDRLSNARLAEIERLAQGTLAPGSPMLAQAEAGRLPRAEAAAPLLSKTATPTATLDPSAAKISTASDECLGRAAPDEPPRRSWLTAAQA
jgi:hypothetical protein